MLAVLSPIVECEWGLSKIEEALITSVSIAIVVLYYAAACPNGYNIVVL